MDKLKAAFPHIAAILIFLAVTVIYLSPALEGKKLLQGDMSSWQGMSKEVKDFNAENEEVTNWTNSMFGGMPAYQIMLKTPSNLLRLVNDLYTLYLPTPLSRLFRLFVGFYILLLCMRVNPWLAIGGSLAFGLSSYHVTIIEAGHVSKVKAISYMGPVLAGVILAYRGKILLGGVLTALFLGLEIMMNHIQITYYLAYVVLAYIIYQAYVAIKNKGVPTFIKASSVLLVAAVFGVFANTTLLWTTYEYGQKTMRGKSDLTIDANLQNKQNNQTSGLDRDYVTRWSYGISETFSLLVPNANGGATGAIGNDADLLKGVNPQFKSSIAQSNQYWGNQPFTSGPFYSGALVILLFILGLVFLKDGMKWPLLIVTIIAIMLAWGKNFMGFTNFFLDYIPLYNKFRTVTMTLVIASLIIPLIGFVFLNKVLDAPNVIKEKLKLFYGVSGGLIGLLVLFYAAPGGFFNFLSDQEITSFSAQMQQSAQNAGQFQAYMDALEDVRIKIFRADVLRSLFFIVLGAALIWLYVQEKVSKTIVIAATVGLVTIDLWMVDKRYLNNEKVNGRFEKWVDANAYDAPYNATNADKQILQDQLSMNPQIAQNIQTALTKRQQEKQQESDPKLRRLTTADQEDIQFRELNKATNFRVFNLAANTFNDASTAYFHKSLGGYHAAKLSRIQDIIDFHLAGGNMNMRVINMFNTQYIITPNQERTSTIAQPNPEALGNAWVVNKIIQVANPDSEIVALRTFNPKTEATVESTFASYVNGFDASQGKGIVQLTEYKPNALTYEANLANECFVVFSEVYYQPGWTAYIDGKETEHIRVNYLLRGMRIPKGTHEIKFEFKPNSYTWGERISLASSGLILLALIGFLFTAFKKGSVFYEQADNQE